MAVAGSQGEVGMKAQSSTNSISRCSYDSCLSVVVRVLEVLLFCIETIKKLESSRVIK